MCETGHTDKQKLSSAPHGGSYGMTFFCANRQTYVGDATNDEPTYPRYFNALRDA
jgi:hypothetical protein